MDAALTAFARGGYSGTTTAAVCREAGIGSGTFFHYFPTKLAVLLAILELGTAEQAEWFAAQAQRDDPEAVIADYLRRTLTDLTDPRVPGFTRAVGSVMGEPDVDAALARDHRTHQEGLAAWLRRASADGRIRDDVDPDDLATWVLVVIDGFIARVATDPHFTVAGQGEVLLGTIGRLLDPAR